jgi:phosphatidate cytidylyltransferase
MDLFGALSSTTFWAYALGCAVPLAAAWGALSFFKLRDQAHPDLWQIYWATLLVSATVVLGTLLGQQVFVLLVVLVSLFACREFARATGLYADWVLTALVYFAILGVNGLALWAGHDTPRDGSPRSLYSYDLFMASPIYVVGALCVVPVLRNRPAGMLPRVALAVMAFVYFGYFMAHLSLLADVGRDEVYSYVFYLTFGSLTTGLVNLLVGRWRGRHPVAPRISTDVTWEGALTALGWAVAWACGLGWTLPHFGPAAMLLSGVLLGVLGLLGDLVMRYVLHDLSPNARESSFDVPSLALNHVYRLVFVAPTFFRLVLFLIPPAPPAV